MNARTTIPADNTAQRQDIRRLIRLLEQERCACTRVEAFADEFRQFRTMQAATRLANAEAQLRHAGEAVDRTCALRLTPRTESDAAASEQDLENDNHGGRDNA